MKVDIYKSATSSNKYISVRAGDDVAKVQTSDPDFAKLVHQNSDVEVTQGEHHAGYNADLIIRDIEQHGYHLHHVKRNFS
ncbi:hypothetical protein SAMN05192560_1310 [Methylobacillus rhizosphaerae]|uniref:Uncharacterized protein n=1 Tax=Methylobacillus rhizosphaerae TaxID=551994 RepID=A0A238ZKY3_9PROT|nr:hypothetical protein [Methylobacillus rhizosphaerae]SNR83638.1 hypothetical protein SAMN05192560_1310 [Methylobacillus rhizosphaerae]